MTLVRGRALLLLLVVAGRASSLGPEKQLVHTSWWPPGSEKESEAVGILSRGLLFTTAMMAVQAKTPAGQAAEVVRDMQDIAAAGNTSLANVVACQVNCKPGSGSSVRQLFRAALPNETAVTVVELLGEYGGLFPFTLKCLFVQSTRLPKTVLRRGQHSIAVAEAGGTVHVSVAGEPNATSALAALESLVSGTVGPSVAVRSVRMALKAKI